MHDGCRPRSHLALFPRCLLRLHACRLSLQFHPEPGHTRPLLLKPHHLLLQLLHSSGLAVGQGRLPRNLRMLVQLAPVGPWLIVLMPGRARHGRGSCFPAGEELLLLFHKTRLGGQRAVILHKRRLQAGERVAV